MADQPTYEQQLSPYAGAPTDARVWIGMILRDHDRSALACDAADIASKLVRSAVRHTPADGMVSLVARLTSDGVIIECRDAGAEPKEPGEGVWADILTMGTVRQFGSTASRLGQLTWVEVGPA
jgi:hypothetical protein